jgi:hypothetical protein
MWIIVIIIILYSWSRRYALTNYFIFNLRLLGEVLYFILFNIKVTPNYAAGVTEGGVGRGMALLILTYGARCGWVVNVAFCLLYPWETATVPIVNEAGWSPGSVCTGMKKRESLVHIEVLTPDSAARSESLYQPHNPSPCLTFGPRILLWFSYTYLMKVRMA